MGREGEERRGEERKGEERKSEERKREQRKREGKETDGREGKRGETNWRRADGESERQTEKRRRWIKGRGC